MMQEYIDKMNELLAQAWNAPIGVQALIVIAMLTSVSAAKSLWKITYPVRWTVAKVLETTSFLLVPTKKMLKLDLTEEHLENGWKKFRQKKFSKKPVKVDISTAKATKKTVKAIANTVKKVEQLDESTRKLLKGAIAEWFGGTWTYSRLSKPFKDYDKNIWNKMTIAKLNEQWVMSQGPKNEGVVRELI